MSSRREGNLPGIARRLRFLRGEETQEAFAKRVGVSRSALANYETGRSMPDDFTLSRICERTGTPVDYFTAHYDAIGEQSPAAVYGAVFEGLPDWTEDEAALIRMLRMSDNSTIREALRVVCDGLATSDAVVRLSAFYVFSEDIQRLRDLSANKRPFAKGSLVTYPEAKPMHRLGFKERPPKGPR